MLQVPDWLFILLAVISILLFAALAVLICWCIFMKTSRKNYKKGLELQEKLFLSPGSPLLPKNAKEYQHPNFMPYTIPSIVQAPSYKSSSTVHTARSYHHVPRFYKEIYKPLDTSSCKSEPVINRAYSPDHQFMYRNSLKNISHLQRPPSHLTGSFKGSSIASSRESSLKSENDDHQGPDAQVSALQGEEVYLHSSLLHEGNLEPDHFFPSEHVVSYDQEGGIDDYPNGALLLSLYYDSEASDLVVSINRAVNLPVTTPREEDLEVYINFCIVPEDFYWQKTVAVSQTRNPVFNQTFHIPDVLHHKLRQYTLCFLVMNSSETQESILGKVMVPLSDLRAGVVVNMCKEVVPN